MPDEVVKTLFCSSSSVWKIKFQAPHAIDAMLSP